MYEDLNTSWFDMRRLGREQFESDGLPRFIEWVKTRSASFRGVTVGTMGRDEGYQFMRLGVFMERADYCMRMLDIKYSEPLTGEAGDARKALGYYQWSALLYAHVGVRDLSAPLSHGDHAGARRRTDDPARRPAAFACCLHVGNAGVLITLSGQPRSEVARQAGALAAETRYGRIEEILAEGMDVYLSRFMQRLFALAREIDRHFLLAGDVSMPAAVRRDRVLDSAPSLLGSRLRRMTYCVAMKLDTGMVFASDSRTNAGIDHISRFDKMRVFSKPGERVIVTLSAGNLSVTQNTLNLLERRSQQNPDSPTSDRTSPRCTTLPN